MSYHHLNSTCKAFATNLFGASIPKNIQKALENLKWRDVVPKEIRALVKNKNREVAELLRDKKTIDCKRVFKN